MGCIRMFCWPPQAARREVIPIQLFRKGFGSNTPVACGRSLLRSTVKFWLSLLEFSEIEVVWFL